MANLCSPCNCIPYINKCGCLPNGGIWITMPQCQVVPGQPTPVNNPCFDGNKSYWTYNLFIDYSDSPLETAVGEFAIPVCIDITYDNIAVFEKVSGYLDFIKRPFELKSSIAEGDNFKMAPEGYQYLVLDIKDRYTSGLCAEYRVEINGNYPEAVGDIQIKRNNEENPIIILGSFLVPAPPLPDKLNIKKSFNTVQVDGSIMINYELVVENTGGSASKNVQLIDNISFNGLDLTLGNVVFQQENSAFSINTIPSMIEINGILGDIEPEQSVAINYSIPIVDFRESGIYEFTNIATALNSKGAVVQADCTFQLDLSELVVNFVKKQENSNRMIFTLGIEGSKNYSGGAVKAEGKIIIPQGVTVEVIKLGNFTAVLEDNSAVEAGAVLTGGEEGTAVILNRKGLEIIPAGITEENIELTILNISTFGKECTLLNSITALEPEQVKPNVFTRVKGIPAAEQVLIQGIINL